MQFLLIGKAEVKRRDQILDPWYSVCGPMVACRFYARYRIY